MNSSSPISINDDLILEILSRLPSKSIARFRCLSKQWASMLNTTSPYFKELFLTRSSAKPRLLFAIVEKGVWSFFSLPQLENPYEPEQSTLVAAAEFHVKFSHDDLRTCHDVDMSNFSCSYASGLFYLHGCGHQDRALISNPITGRYAILPYIYSYKRYLYVFFGFDPIDMQYKALRMAHPFGCNRHKTLTLGDGDMKWRKVKGSLRHEIKSDGICINGVLYYLGYTPNCFNDDHAVTSAWIIVCFDLRSEKITCIDINRSGKLINYRGKLALIYWGDDYAINELHMLVLDDVEKHEWSKHAYPLTHDKLFRRHLRIAGATTWGEIMFSVHKYTPKQPFYVFYFNPERNTLKRVEIKGFGEYSCTVFTFVNHIEDLDVNDLKVLKSVHPPLTEPDYVEEAAPEYESD